MSGDSTLPTSPTLLGRLSRLPADQAAWAEFAERYGRKIYGWCRHWRLQQADAEEVTQEVLLKLARKMQTFAYDPSRSFRAWLKTVTHHAWRDFVDGRRRTQSGSGDTQVLEMLQTVQAGDNLVEQLDDEFARELLDEALARVRVRVQPHTWQAFHLLAFEGLSGAEAASRLNMKIATVFVARSKVQKMIHEELRRLDGNQAT
ncbi:MAG TPA: sigma-70 family RNA polymerase sigma factor [Gemmataceae bacterium]|jgi:RNA polymerase sigma-70 factor (ECF subfamily)|nr:sigma-70 family RNA polymerase sigma factor [Gemmataceae bacterium]